MRRYSNNADYKDIVQLDYLVIGGTLTIYQNLGKGCMLQCIKYIL